MRVLVACEYSGTVRNAFLFHGHDAYSCDLLPTEGGFPERHFQCDIFDVLYQDWDLIISHPPCTFICNSGNRHYAKTVNRHNAAMFIWRIWSSPCKKLCIENPIGQINTYLPDIEIPQYVHPWEYGHKKVKKTGLWKRNLPDLKPTNIVGPPPPAGSPERKEWETIWRMAPAPDRGKERSRFYKGIAEAMAVQWGNLK